ncbi:hypothetical protein HMPREF9083_0481 [Dialister micraerophilus DSM 19965]|uniref:Uncharacterized protein n=1 Tax=Dialister micraerophilus DSM 19965 TaxID=888062 RepID=F2BWB4_9FIRM|nr:hypothetical protein HMPREF9083_0481 [Dialister micraerophilus DSM 19965]
MTNMQKYRYKIVPIRSTGAHAKETWQQQTMQVQQQQIVIVFHVFLMMCSSFINF